jgi:hypothetical protein
MNICSKKQLCNDNNCQLHFNKTFASYEKARCQF